MDQCYSAIKQHGALLLIYHASRSENMSPTNRPVQHSDDTQTTFLRIIFSMIIHASTVMIDAIMIMVITIIQFCIYLRAELNSQGLITEEGRIQNANNKHTGKNHNN
jgi:hypothetical protein